MNKTGKYTVALEIVKREIGIGAVAETNTLSDSFFHEIITEGTKEFCEVLGDKPTLLSLNVICDSQIVEKKIFTFEWTEDDTFHLIQKYVLVDGGLTNLDTDIGDILKKEARQGQEKNLLERIDEALDNKDEETFRKLTNQLNELQKGASNG